MFSHLLAFVLLSVLAWAGEILFTHLKYDFAH